MVQGKKDTLIGICESRWLALALSLGVVILLFWGIATGD
jgi:hypothetical protein